MTNNVSAGGRHAGFWFDLMSGNPVMNAGKRHMVFRDNTVHSHQAEEGTCGDGSLCESWAMWFTNMGGGDIASQSTEGVLLVERLTAYKNAKGVETELYSVVTDSILADNQIAFTEATLRNSVVVSRSANTDTHADWGRVGMFTYVGDASAENVTFVGFRDGRRAVHTLVPGLENARFWSRGVRLVNSEIATGAATATCATLTAPWPAPDVRRWWSMFPRPRRPTSAW